MSDQIEIIHVAPDRLRPNPWNTNKITDPANEEKLRESLRRFKFTKPIIVRTLPGGVLEILGGEHRWKAAVQMGSFATVPIVNLGLIDDQRAKEIGLMDNGRYGEDDALGLAGLLKELGNDVMSFMPYSDMELQSILAASEISFDDLDSVDNDALPDLNAAKAAPANQLLRFKVPVEDVSWISNLIEKIQKTEGFKEEDSLSNAGHALMSLLKRAERSL